VTLDLELRHLEILPEVELVVTHHPLLFRPVGEIHPHTPLGRKLRALLVHEVALFALHTPYDVARGGLGEVLAGYLGLQDVKPLLPRGKLLKLVVFVPIGHEDRVAQALFAAGAGKLGKYGHCSFRTQGMGTFLPEEGARPFLGEVGREEQAEEVRLETILPAERLDPVLRAMREAHPYEEVAYDLYPLANPSSLHGLGRIGELPEPCPISTVLRRFAAGLGVRGPREVVGAEERTVRRVAVCGGSGGDLIPQASAAQADLYITGDASYHRLREAEEAALPVALFGHAETERPFVGHIAGLLRRAFPAAEVVEG
jgi:dinuclear metal center YbgI/SA1388 family protein